MLLLLACTTPKDNSADDSASTPSTTDSSTAINPLDALDPCEPLMAGDRLDILNACIDHVCIGDTQDAADAGYGAASTCVALSGIALCFWGDGILGSFDDVNGDYNPDFG